MSRLPKVLFQKPLSDKDLLRWSEQVHDYLEQLERWGQGVERTNLEKTVWHDIPIRNFYEDTLVSPSWTPISASGTPNLTYSAQVIPYAEYFRLALSTGLTNVGTEIIYTTVRVPPRYIKGNDLTFRLDAEVTQEEDQATAPAQRSLDVVVRRWENVTSGVKRQGFGYNSDWAWDSTNAWQTSDWNTDLCKTSAKTSIVYLNQGDLKLSTYDFSIEANDATYPLRAGDKLLIEITGVVEGGVLSKTASLFFCDCKLGVKESA